jgi:hypothetical protein
VEQALLSADEPSVPELYEPIMSLVLHGLGASALYAKGLNS